MSCFKLLVSLCHEIKALIQKKIWGHRGDARKIHWVKWQDLCKPKSYGGIGFKDFSWFKDALLAKHTGRLLHDDVLIWPFSPNGEYTVQTGYKFL